MDDLKKIEKNFLEFLKPRLKNEIFDLSKIKITEELFEKMEIIEVPFGAFMYFLAREDEKPVLYVEAGSRMGTKIMCFFDVNGWEEYDVYDGNKEIRERYYSQSKKIKRRETKDILKIKRF